PQDSDDELDDERAFLIDVGLKFINTKYEGHLGFKWRDPLSATVGRGFEFIVEYPTDSDQVVRDKFALAVAKCAWERMHEKSYEEGEEAEFQKIVDDAEAEDLENLLNSVTIDESDILAAVADHKPDLTPVKQQPPLRKPKEPAALAMGIVTVSVIGSLFLFDPHTSEFVLLDKEVALSVVEMSKFTYFINVISNRKNYVSQLVDPDMNAVFNNEHRSLIWNYFDSTGSYSFSFKAADERHYESLHQGMTKAAYETLNREPWGKMKEDSQDYVLDANEEDLDAMPVPAQWSDDDDDDDDDDEGQDKDEVDQSYRRVPVPKGVKTGQYGAESKSEYFEEEDSEDSEEEDSENEHSAYGTGSEDDDYSGSEAEHDNDGDAKNSTLAVGYKHGRSFVVRGSRIGVFKHTNKDGIKFDTTINKIDDTRGNRFTPTSAMLHQQDSALILSDAANPHALYKMDLEYGKVVEEWKVHEDIPTLCIAPSSKYSQMTDNQTVVGLSHNMLYRIDPRVGGGGSQGDLIVQNELQSYTTKSHFTALATTEDGAIAVASANGAIRLFDRLCVRAKTSLPALGEPILGIDVTSDGRYVVATCRTYLLLIDTKLPPSSPDSNASKKKTTPAAANSLDTDKLVTGFQKPFPQSQKPSPRRLQLRPEHVVYMDAPICFTPAKFNQTPNGTGSERTIVTSTGPFVITWNLHKALKKGGSGDAYQIKQYKDTVVADNFRFGQDRSIVVALPDDVQTVRRSQMAKPTRESLMLQSSGAALARDKVVDEPKY
ncbi:Vacuolar import and degradation protein 27, partial [Kickxella alabastrina]